jgi:sulfur carrier protein
MASESIEITVNGEPRTLARPATVADLIAALGHAGRRVAVERNGAIVPRSRHAETALAPADRIEIVVAVGGG